MKDQHLTAPPGSPVEADRYIIPSGATGVWAGKKQSDCGICRR
ncbi:DUF2793 domain-containing protein [Paenibacillus rhizoplanae]